MKFIKTKYQKTTFSCVEEFVDDMIEVVLESEDEFSNVTVVSNTETMTEIFRKLVTIEVNGFKPEFGIVDINAEEYDDLYYLTFGKDGKIWVEKAWHETNQWHKAGYLMTESTLIYVNNYDVNDEIMETLNGNDILIFDIEDED